MVMNLGETNKFVLYETLELLYVLSLVFPYQYEVSRIS